MATSGGRTQLQRDPSAMRCADVAVACERLAADIGEGKPQARILDGLRQAGTLCRAAASEMASDQERTTELSRLGTAIDTWRAVWPRLSHDPTTGASFRAAVVRECGLWSRRLCALAQATTRS